MSSRSAQNRRGRGRGAADRRPGGEDNWIEAAEVACRLLVQLGTDDDAAPLLAFPAVAGIVINAQDAASAGRLVEAAHAAGCAAFLLDRPDLVDAVTADGVLLNGPSEVAVARSHLSAGALIGVACGTSRHDAMVAGEDGADYVLFGSVGASSADSIERLVEHVVWWSALAVLPCVVAGRFSADDVAQLADAGADFILPALDGDPKLVAALAAALPAQQR